MSVTKARKGIKEVQLGYVTAKIPITAVDGGNAFIHQNSLNRVVK